MNTNGIIHPILTPLWDGSVAWFMSTTSLDQKILGVAAPTFMGAAGVTFTSSVT